MKRYALHCAVLVVGLVLSACPSCVYVPPPPNQPTAPGIVSGDPQYEEFIDMCHPIKGTSVPSGGFSQKDSCWSKTWLNIFDIPGVNIPCDPQTQVCDLTPALGCIQGSDDTQPCSDVGPAIKALWNAFGSGNGPGAPGTSVLYIPAGKYKLKRTAMVLDQFGSAIIGEDPATTTIQWEPESKIWTDMFQLVDVGSFKLNRLTLDGSNQALVLVRMLQSCCYGAATSEAICKLPIGGNEVCKLPQAPSTPGLYQGGAYNILTTDDVFTNAAYGIGIDGYGWGIVPHPDIKIVNSNMGLNQVRRSIFKGLTVAAVMNQNQNSLDWLIADNQFTGNSGRAAIFNYAGSVHVVDNYFNENNRDMVLLNGPNAVRGNRSDGSNAFLWQANSFVDVSGNYVVTSGKSFPAETNECALLGAVSTNACSYAFCGTGGASLLDNYFEVPSTPGSCTAGGQDFGGVAVFSLEPNPDAHMQLTEGGNHYAAKLMFEDDAVCGSSTGAQPDSFICTLEQNGWGMPRRIKVDSADPAMNDVKVNPGTGCASGQPAHACATYNNAYPTGPLMQSPAKSDRYLVKVSDWPECTTPGTTGCAAKINSVVSGGFNKQPFAVYFPAGNAGYNLEDTVVVPPGVDVTFLGDGLNSRVFWKGQPWADAAPQYLFHMSAAGNVPNCPLAQPETISPVCPAVASMRDLILNANPNSGSGAGAGGILVDTLDQPSDMVYADAPANSAGGYLPAVSNPDWHDIVMGPVDQTALRIDQGSSGVLVVGAGAAQSNSALTTGVTAFAGGPAGEIDVANFGKAVLIGVDAEGTYAFGTGLTNGYLSESVWRMFSIKGTDPQSCNGFLVNPLVVPPSFQGTVAMLGGVGTTPLVAAGSANAQILSLTQMYGQPNGPPLSCLAQVSTADHVCDCATYASVGCTMSQQYAIDSCAAVCPKNTFDVQTGQQAQVACTDVNAGVYLSPPDVEPAGWNDSNIGTLAHSALADLRGTFEAPKKRQGFLTNVRIHNVVRMFDELNEADPNAQFGPMMTIKKP